MSDSSIQTHEPAASRLLYCQQAKELLGAFNHATQHLMVLHQEQLHAVVGDDFKRARIDYLIKILTERKHQAKYAYLHHLETHGCSTNPGTHD